MSAVKPLNSCKRRSAATIATTDPQDLFNDDLVDVVLICTHHDLHVPLAIEAAEAGKQIFVEKPLALTIEGCEQIEAAVERTGVKLMTGFQARFLALHCQTQRGDSNPRLSLSDSSWIRGGAMIVWANDPIEGGGNVLSQGCHLFDAMCWLAGAEPTTVYAEGGNLTHPKIPEITDSVVATIRFANGWCGERNQWGLRFTGVGWQGVFTNCSV